MKHDLSPDRPEELVGSTFTIDDRPETSIAGLPMTLVVAGLEDQLARSGGDYTPSDYLSPILDAVAMLKQRHENDSTSLAMLDNSLRKILARIVQTLQQDWHVEFSQLGLDSDSADYPNDVQELYRFFIIERNRYAKELIEQVVATARRQLVERYRKSVEKKNQTVAEARRVFLNFDDVVIWVSMPQILEDLRDEGSWGFDFADSLVLLGANSSTFLSRLAAQWNPEDFAVTFCTIALSKEQMVTTRMAMQDSWMTESPKKTETETESVE